MTTEHLSEKALTVKRIQLTAVLAVLCFIIGGIAVFSTVLSVIITAVSIAAYIYFFFIYLRTWQKTYFFTISDDYVLIKKGVLVTKDIQIYKSKIQYSAVIRTPLQRLFHTCTIIYHTAGAVVYLSEIDEEYSLGAVFNESNR